MFNLQKLAFSAPGSYLAIGKDRRFDGAGVWIRTLIRPCFGDGKPDPSDHVMRVVPAAKDGTFAEYTLEFLPHKLVFHIGGETDGSSRIEAFFSDWDAVTFVMHNASLCLEYGHGDNTVFVPRLDRGRHGDAKNRFSAYLPVTFYEITLETEIGNVTHDTNYHRLSYVAEERDSFQVEFRARHTRVEEVARPYPYKNPDDLKRAFDKFSACYPLDTETAHAAIARYILFSIRYEARGFYKRPACAASKNKLNLVWNWDNCFAGLAVSKADPRLCWDTILMFFELQKPNGQLPDAVSPLVSVDWYLKPPVHGLFIEWLLDRDVPPTPEDAAFLYPRLVRWTEFWQNEFLHEDTGLFYYKHGNDSGWDNATCFDAVPCVSPDLNAYMILQMYALSRLAVLLGRSQEAAQDAARLKKEAAQWERKADSHLALTLGTLWDNTERAFLHIGPDGKKFKSTSLIRMLPIILGKKLPVEVRNALADELKTGDHFLTRRGFATESVKSPLYDQRRGGSASAYWRGAIWAPSTLLLLKGLVNIGETAFAKEAATRYLKTLESKPDTFYENYDALLDTGCDDYGFGWTAASYVLLKDEGFYNE
ncbi:MAG: hypothetical protein LBK61_13360 [Spirochaetaceae bacterium]|jgi:hypothetical protein|nr:hypothetical protein [Spirochaetaceae bacterium]